jgi:copper chaperone CopZ
MFHPPQEGKLMSSCCTPDGSCHTGDTEAEAGTVTTVADGHSVTYRVNGVGSAHCQGVVTKALNDLDAVLSVDAGIGTGLVTVVTGGTPDDELIAKAIEDAGYEFAGRA